MKKYGFLLWVLLVTIGVMSAHTGALAQVTNVPLFIVEYDNQTSANTVSSPYYYLSERIVENNPGDVSTVSLTYPGPGSPISYPAPFGPFNVSFYGSPSYSSLSGLNTDYQFGDYTTSYTGNYNGSDTVVYDQNNLATSTPTFTASTYNALQGLNAANGITLNFDSFTGALPTSYVFATFFNANTSAEVYDVGGGFLSPYTTSVYLPGGTLDPGTNYYVTLIFSNRGPATDGNGVDVSENWDYETNLSFATAPAPAPEASSAIPLGLMLIIGGNYILDSSGYKCYNII